MRYKNAVIFDLETTGFSVKSCEIIELAAIVWSPSGIEESYATLAVPRKTIPSHITKITGISRSSYKKEPSCKLSEALAYFGSLVQGPETLVVSHNGDAFDLPILKANGLNIDSRRSWDTMLQTRAEIAKKTKGFWKQAQTKAKLYRTKQKVNLLDAAKFYKIKIDKTKTHRALYDAELCLNIFKKQYPKYKTLFSSNIQ